LIRDSDKINPAGDCCTMLKDQIPFGLPGEFLIGVGVLPIIGYGYRRY